MRINHQKHHKTYIGNFNKTIEKLKSAVTRCCVYFYCKIYVRKIAGLSTLKFHFKDLDPKHHETYIDNFTKSIEMLKSAVTIGCVHFYCKI
ncbi:hypothetical protein FWK35_00023639 [Aphis craccivora]|uniref:Uncharacterized protein n=1 Tax=Aphis craccivora TaxID=307492 RepID=A0A6G0WLY7_APHCR|nr:hypothetical protein FWK35_00023639 [Aphis craccivora]